MYAGDVSQELLRRIPNGDNQELLMAAELLHSRDERWVGRLFGWQAIYQPAGTSPAFGHHAAHLIIGEVGSWFAAVAWSGNQTVVFRVDVPTLDLAAQDGSEETSKGDNVP